MKSPFRLFFSYYCILIGVVLICSSIGDGLVIPETRLSRISSSPVGPLHESEGPPGFPNVIIYPKPGWGLSKPKPKKALEDIGKAQSAAAWILNLVEWMHWVSFPIGFWLFWTMFNHMKELGSAINPSNPTFSVFFLLFAHVSQVYGGGISGNMMHQYEGWQVAPFRNPLRTDAEPEYNDAWLRAVAYQMLFSFQTLGVVFTWVGVGGPVTGWLKRGLLLVTALVITLAPQLPHCTTVFPNLMKRIRLEKFWNRLTCGNRPVFPLSIYLFLAFLANSIVATLAYIQMFGVIDWTGTPILQSLPGLVSSLIPFLLIAFGGIYEGLRAETTFNQWDHFLAFLFLDLGLLLHVPYYLKLIGV